MVHATASLMAQRACALRVINLHAPSWPSVDARQSGDGSGGDHGEGRRAPWKMDGGENE